MSPMQGLYKLIDRFVDGEVSILWSSDFKRKYTIPSCFKDIYWPRYEHRKFGKYEKYRDWEHLVELARKAIENGDLHNSPVKIATCGLTMSDPKHIDHESGVSPPRRLVVSDKKALQRMKAYAWAIGRYRLGLEVLVDAIPFAGSLIMFIMSVCIFWHGTSQTAAPAWLRREMLGPLGWATFFAFFVPEVGDVASASISPNRRAARKLKHWLKLRSLLSSDIADSSGVWTSPGLKEVFPELRNGGSYSWRYDDHFRRKIYGKELEQLYQTKHKV
ncbi:hypothetical protein CI109_105540 [Kwoniella shandongensis]|uniref:Uncharacterized protein n=1 Tax=Kwoniella shandongensis TaxID=1734106 RepID=A0AAJ8LPY7_9TREE